jgi:hypothetical protein
MVLGKVRRVGSVHRVAAEVLDQRRLGQRVADGVADPLEE